MDEQSPSVGPTYRHDRQPKGFVPHFEPTPFEDDIRAHIEAYVGPISNVFHELISDHVHIDLFIVNPTKIRPFYTLVTSGMSTRKMMAPEEMANCTYSELFLCLPPDWNMDSKSWNDDRHVWPINMLKFLARFPHAVDTWLWLGHTIPNGDPAAPFADNTRLSSVILLPPLSLPEDFGELTIDDKTAIHFFSIVPLHNDELAYKFKHGARELLDKLVHENVSEILQVNRRSVLSPPPKKSGFFARLFGR